MTDRSSERRRTIGRGRARTAATLCAAGAAMWFSGAPAGAQTGVLSGRVVDRDAKAPLPFAGITVGAHGAERLANDAGLFRITDLPAGTTHVRVRRVGYAPLDTEVVIRAGDTTSVTFALAHIAVTLAAVKVTDEPCAAPGAPSVADANLAAVFVQLTLNAEQFRLVSKQYPFITVLDRYYGQTRERLLPPAPADSLPPRIDTVDVFTRTDTVPIRSDQPWKYAPGRVVVEEGLGPLGVRYGVEIPTLAVFADPEFIKNHCFRDGGVASIDGQELRRIDFRAAAKIRDPDLDGTIYLDPSTFVIRRSVISLSKPSPRAERYSAIQVETQFDEVVPGVPIIVRTNGHNIRTEDAASHQGDQSLPRGHHIVADIEQQYARTVRFLRTAPSGARDVIHYGRLLGVFNADTGEPIPGVAVRDSVSGMAVITSGTGTVGLTFIPRTSAVLVIDHPGYERERLPVSLTLRDTVPITVVLRPTRG